MSYWRRISSCETLVEPRLQRESRRCREGGFILGVAMIMILVLAIAGLGFSQLDSLERGITWKEVDDHNAFYLASAGLERARTAYKAQFVSGNLTWTPLLKGTVARYPLDPDPAAGNWPNPCVIPPFQTNSANPNVIPPNRDGDPVTPVSLDPTIPPDLPFSGTLTQGSYTVRAFDNADGDGPSTDRDGIITVRAVGTSGITYIQRRVLEFDLLATLDLGLINCQGDPGERCPDVINGNPVIQPSPGRSPDSHPVLPSLPPLEDPLAPGACNLANYYCDPDNPNYPDNNLNKWRKNNNLPSLTKRNLLPVETKIVKDKPKNSSEVQFEDDKYYFTDHDVEIKGVSNGHNVVIVSLGNILVATGVTLTDSVIVAGELADFRGGVTLRAPPPYPAVISGGAVHANANVEIFGGIYSSGTVDLNPIKLHGVLIGEHVEIQGGAGTLYTDDGNPMYYAPMPGVTYPNALVTTRLVGGSWRERNDLE